jgi:predicted N-acetyltransferase YhbS
MDRKVSHSSIIYSEKKGLMYMKIRESGYIIRSARIEDLSFLSQIEQAAAKLFMNTSFPFLVDAEPLPLVLLQQLFKAGTVWVATNNCNTVIGHAVAREVDGTLYLQQIDVIPEHGRRGIGSALVNIVCSWAKTHSYQFVSLSTFRDIPWNAPFYSKLGFRIVSESELTNGFHQIRLQEVAAGLPLSERVYYAIQVVVV